ncbi:hypothetical protein QO010_000123 [Caulobacter ginsengisoli]|uniref:Beta propeller domain-containing protein n=1 Tax=Caulobacter ginsengisoli TaxID=400775 RepID=A0ABU0ILV4_9CAUL|nr:beta-propeller domain-containing protein [Caulobacter ginsengisoli]MDQ0462375.1 hypothetical protein [Caulobacter ginsengisoli]
MAATGRRTIRRVLIGAMLGLFVTVAGLSQDFSASAATPSGGLIAFASDAEFRQFLIKRRKADEARYSNVESAPADLVVTAAVAPPPPPAVMPSAAAAPAADAPALASKVAAPGITNNQEANVDEGDIVKTHGDHLVILRRGRLFTVSVARGTMTPVAAINAYPPGVDGRGSWYDEMLVSDDLVVVIGYSYARSGTEINRFRIDDAGGLTFLDAYQLKSNDYYSDRNYASRLIGRKLVFYTPLWLGWSKDPMEVMPALRRWSGQTGNSGFKRIAGGRQIYIPRDLRDDTSAQIEVLHSVTTCDVTTPVMDCKAIGVLGSSSRNFYVSGSAIYLWTIEQSYYYRRSGGPPSSRLYRLPLDGGRPSAVKARGAPVDQFSFREDAAEGVLNVLVRSEGYGDAMWRPEFSNGTVALLRLPISAFGDGRYEARRERYRLLPKPKGNAWAFQNRFAGDYLLYGLGRGWGSPQAGDSTLTVVPVRGGPVTQLALGQSIDRLDLLGGDAIVIGGEKGGVVFTTIELPRGAAPRVGDRYVRAEASEAESRSHAFFYRADDDSPDGASGIMGLPVARPARPVYRQLFENSTAMVFVRRQDRRLSGLGELAAGDTDIRDDSCVASCVDWYGNARPIFWKGRVFALMGYELVEGRVAGGRVSEVGRVSYAPRAKS